MAGGAGTPLAPRVVIHMPMTTMHIHPLRPSPRAASTVLGPWLLFAARALSVCGIMLLSVGVTHAQDGRGRGGTPTGRVAIPRHSQPGPPVTTPPPGTPAGRGTNTVVPPSAPSTDPPAGPSDPPSDPPFDPPSDGPGQQGGPPAQSPFDGLILPPPGNSVPQSNGGPGESSLVVHEQEADSIPEPGTMLLVGAGLAAYTVRRRRARNRA
jgi:hypothetical protein